MSPARIYTGILLFSLVVVTPNNYRDIIEFIPYLTCRLMYVIGLMCSMMGTVWLLNGHQEPLNGQSVLFVHCDQYIITRL